MSYTGEAAFSATESAEVCAPISSHLPTPTLTLSLTLTLTLSLNLTLGVRANLEPSRQPTLTPQPYP